MTWIDTKYVTLLSNRLLKFKRKSGVLYNFRCPLCLDSETNRHKARGYLFQRAGKFAFYCHNCQSSLSFKKFIRAVDPGIYEDYLLELYRDAHDIAEPKSEKQKKKLDNKALDELKSVASLMTSHKAYKYIAGRQIPKSFWKEIYYAETFKAWTNSQVPDKFKLDYEEERIILPLYDRTKKMFGYNARALDPANKVRYISIILDENRPKIWGWDQVDFNRKFFVLEGPFDSMFIENAIASVGGKISSELLKIGCELDNAIICYDNEPRNDQVVANVRKAAITNYHVVIWPENYPYKDINEMVLDRISIEWINKFLHERTFKGLDAELEFMKWRKI